ncbi:MAG: 3-oxoacyl-[acyl-carrier protein] reductase [Methylobacteriaceae bacterium]|jgi:3-oxoacyl-[acyl-carrier protein] reductase|nr:3-oxoacyl-[acyl-carrier protein] reductase [Methylobacteriaceae bacterium]
MTELRGAVALVTGASRGIGKGIALAFGRAGMRVAVNYQSRANDAEAVVAAIEEAGGDAIALRADVAQSGDVERLVGDVERAFGPINVLVNNAGILGVLHYDQVDEAEWERVMRTNLTSAFLVTKAVLPGMLKAGWGRIINLSSVAAQTGGATAPHYAASKAGLVGMTHSYAARLAKTGITANAIAPALIETDMVTDGLKASPERIPLGRFGTLEEAGETALFLVRNGFVNGQTINLNGGLYMSS